MWQNFFGETPGERTPQVLYRKDPWVKEITKGDFKNFSFFVVSPNSSLFRFVLKFVKQYLDVIGDVYQEERGQASWSYRIDVDAWSLSYPDTASEEEVRTLKEKDHTTLTLGFGEFILNFRGQKIYMIYKETSRNDVLMVFFIKGKNNQKPLKDFAQFLAVQNMTKRNTRDYFSIFRYSMKDKRWMRAHEARVRSEKSVILPNEMKKKLLDDVKDFLDEDTKKWYFEKGMPYKRSYLFYGVPGSGKTSLISVLAGEYKKDVCYLAPTDPAMTDEILKDAIISAPRHALLIFEDVDGLFTKERKSSVRNHLTFSGLLNALDGVGSGLGQIFILTTNFRDRLDNALIRNGRVDMQLEFKHVTHEQVEEMFGLFYNDADQKAKIHFRERVFELLEQVSDEPCLSAAMLQNFFITHRKCTYEEAIDQVEDLVTDVKNAISEYTKKELDKQRQENEAKAKTNGNQSKT